MTLLAVLLWISAAILGFFSRVGAVRASTKPKSTAEGVGVLLGGLFNLYNVGVTVAAAIVVGSL